jgi:hypothetical protein
MSQGYIKLYRKIRQSPIFNDMQLYRLWTICLTEASHAERDQIIGKQTVHLQEGEFVTGRFDLMEMYNNGLKQKDKVKGEKTVFRWLETLEKGGYLTIKKTNKFSIVSIDNWGLYQQDNGKEGPDNDHQKTNKRPSNDHQMTTNKNVKNDKNVKNEDIKDIPDKSQACDYELSELLYQLMLENNDKAKKPNFKAWADSIRLMREKDKYTVEQIEKLIKWSQANDFWKGNILSAKKLREKAGTLRIQRNAELDKKRTGKGQRTGSMFQPSEATLEAQKKVKPLTAEERKELEEIEKGLEF